MEYRDLGKTGVKAGVVGLGMEYLENAPRETVVSVVREALDSGLNDFDLWMATPGVRDAMGEAILGRRDEAFIAGHVGAVLVDGKTDRSRDPSVAGRNFDDFLRRLGTDHVDAAMLFFVDEPADFGRVFAPGGTAEYAAKLKENGKTRFVGMSSHYAPSALRAVRSGLIDILMFPVNPAFDSIPSNLRIEALWESETYAEASETKKNAVSVKRELYLECAKRGVAIVAMKPFAAGWLFKKDNPSFVTLTPVQCLHYALSQPAVVTAVPGCKNVEELRGCLEYLVADAAEREYGTIASNGLWKLEGKCMYCDHCLPCPAAIDVGRVTMLVDSARGGMTPLLRAQYVALDRHADDCVECGDCTRRCPFGVDVVSAMREGSRIFA